MMPLLKNHVIVSWPLPNVAMSYLIVCWFGRELRASKTCQHKSSTARETQNLKLNQKPKPHSGNWKLSVSLSLSGVKDPWFHSSSFCRREATTSSSVTVSLSHSLSSISFISLPQFQFHNLYRACLFFTRLSWLF